MKRILTLLSICILLVFSCTACSNSYAVLTQKEKSTKTSWSSEHTLFSGTRTKKITVSEDNDAAIQVDITTEKGNMDVLITDKDGKTYYQGTALETSNFSVSLNRAGKYIIQIKAKKHTGSFAFSWE